jgi:hypothetical protein
LSTDGYSLISHGFLWNVLGIVPMRNIAPEGAP